jgi:hypothetical protein
MKNKGFSLQVGYTVSNRAPKNIGSQVYFTKQCALGLKGRTSDFFS